MTTTNATKRLLREAILSGLFQTGVTIPLSKAEAFASTVIQRFAQSTEWSGEQDPFYLLTAQRRRVLALTAQGYTREEVAEQMCLSVHTVKSHLKFVTQQYGARNATHCVAIAFKYGILNKYDVSEDDDAPPLKLDVTEHLESTQPIAESVGKESYRAQRIQSLAPGVPLAHIILVVRVLRLMGRIKKEPFVD